MLQVLKHPVRSSLIRQANHWLQASARLAVLDHLASGGAWQGIDHQLGTLLRDHLLRSVQQVTARAESLKKKLEGSATDDNWRSCKRELMDLRSLYLKAEETIHFYTVAINSRTTSNVAALLRACDILCVKSMRELLQPLGKDVPPVLTYIDKGIGASILKAGLRLWDGNLSPVAAIKITQHNLFRPTAIIHETGHQVAHILSWTEELSKLFLERLNRHPKAVGAAFAGWSSEITADAFAFAHTGYAAVAALHDVVSGYPAAVFAFNPRDPHPISYVRVLLGIEMCRRFYGPGPWDQLEVAFKNDYDINLVNFPSVGLIRICGEALREVVDLIFHHPFAAFNGQSLARLVPPEKAGPRELEKLEYLAGPGLYTSHGWIWKEAIRLLALNGYRIGLGEGDLSALYRQQEEWMIKLGFSVELN